MTAIIQRSTNSLLSAFTVAALIAGGAGKAVASYAQNETQVNAPATEISQASQAPESATEKTQLSIEQIIAKVKEQGYSDISDIDREDGRYSVEARDPGGKEVEFFVEAKTGEIVKKMREAKDSLSREEVIAKLKEKGFSDVSKIKRKGEKNQYWVMATDADGKKFELHVNAKTGEIKRKEQRCG